MALFRGIQEYIALDAYNIVNISGNIFLYPPHGPPIFYNYCPGNKDIIALLFTKRGNVINFARAILSILPGLYVNNHLALIYVYDMS